MGGKGKPGRGPGGQGVLVRRAVILQNEVREGSAGKVILERRLAGGGGALWLFRNRFLGRGHSTDGNPEQRLPGTFQEPQRNVRRDEWVRGWSRR